MLSSPIYAAICRDCAGEESPDPTCWQCRGQVVYRVDDEPQADLVFGMQFDGSGIGFGFRPTHRFRAWLQEVGAE